MPSKRLLTAIIGLPLFALLIFWGSPFYFFLAALIVALWGQKEFYELLEVKDVQAQKLLGMLMGALLLRGFFYEDFTLILRVMVLALFLILIFRTFSRRDVTHAVTEIGITFMGIMYVCLLIGFLILIRGVENGQAWIFFLFLVVWAGDAGAYYLGRRFGKHKLYPRISPKKTWEGAAGGLLCSLIASAAGKIILFPEHGLVPLCTLGACLGLIGQVGDLVESLLKRSSGIKDSGSLFPGHGGVLDRFDSVLFAAPVLYYAVWLGTI